MHEVIRVRVCIKRMDFYLLQFEFPVAKIKKNCKNAKNHFEMMQNEKLGDFETIKVCMLI